MASSTNSSPSLTAMRSPVLVPTQTGLHVPSILNPNATEFKLVSFKKHVFWCDLSIFRALANLRSGRRRTQCVPRVTWSSNLSLASVMKLKELAAH
jgi:hypothetical protein